MEWKIKSARKDPNSAMRCKICKGKPTRWYKLMGTTVYRCEQHKREIQSNVYDQGRISTDGELIGMEVNKTFEVGIINNRKYGTASLKDIEKQKLEHLNCDEKEKDVYISEADPDKLDKLKKLIQHFKEKHQALYKSITYTDSKGIEHNLYLEDPEQFFRSQQSLAEVLSYYCKPIPKDLVGTDVSASDLRNGVYKIGI